MRTANPSADMDEGARRSPYAKKIAEAITQSIRDGQAESVCLVMPTEMCRRIKEALPQEEQAAVAKTIEAHMIDAPLVEVLERLRP